MDVLEIGKKTFQVRPCIRIEKKPPFPKKISINKFRQRKKILLSFPLKTGGRYKIKTNHVWGFSKNKIFLVGADSKGVLSRQSRIKDGKSSCVSYPDSFSPDMLQHRSEGTTFMVVDKGYSEDRFASRCEYEIFFTSLSFEVSPENRAERKAFSPFSGRVKKIIQRSLSGKGAETGVETIPV
nr:hypothetical protein [uncultured Dethiosulfovibrio sp.]